MFKLVAKEVAKVSSKRAAELIKLNVFDGQRGLRTNWAQYLGQCMKDGTFRTGHVVLARVQDGPKFMLNGQHQCQGSVLADQSFYALLEEYACDSESDMWKLYATFDVSKTRSVGDIIKAARPRFEAHGLRDVPLRLLETCSAALLVLGDGTKPNFGAKSFSRVTRPDLLEKYHEDVEAVHRILDDAMLDRVRLCTGVATAVIACMRVSRTKATDFWARVLANDGLAKGTAEWHCQKHIQSIKKVSQSRTIMAYDYNGCVAWWNSYIRGEKRKSVKLGAIKTPLEPLAK